MVASALEPGQFTKEQLERSIPFDVNRRLTGVNGSNLVCEIWEAIKGRDRRERGRKPDDEKRLMLTLEILLANLLAAHFNRIDSERFVATPFGNGAFSNTDVSTTSLALLRDLLGEAGLIEGSNGFRAPSRHDEDYSFNRLTRLRASNDLIAKFETEDVDRSSLRLIAKPADVIVLKDTKGKAMALDQTPLEPPEVTASRSVLIELNAALNGLDLALPNDAWARVAERFKKAEDVQEEAHRLIAGDESRRVLYRVFNGDWTQGGRIYGGWWMQLPKSERRHLTINGEPTSELDYVSLHPAILYAQEGKVLDFDPYTVPGYEGPEARELSKRTFLRYINPSKKYGSKGKLRQTALDKAQLLPNKDFQAYLRSFLKHIGPLKAYVGEGVGMSLQRIDSDIAITVLSHLSSMNIVALPIHDSFIVSTRHKDTLRVAMTIAYKERFGLSPLIR